MKGYQDTGEVRVICLGDSITHGYPLGPKHAWVNILRQKTGMQMVNQGINGDTTINMLNRFRRDVLAQGATHLHLLGGANDAWLGVDLSVSQRCIEKMVGLGLEHGITPIVGLPTPICHNPAGGTRFFPRDTELTALKGWLVLFRKWLWEFTEANGILLVDYYNPLCGPGTDHGNPDCFLDECHLNEHGNGAMVAVALKTLHDLFNPI